MVSQAANPIVKAGKMIWYEMVNANWSRDRISAVRSIGISSPVSCDPLRMGEHLEPVVACDAHAGEAQGAFPHQRRAIAPCLPRDALRRRRHDARGLQRRHSHLPSTRTRTGIDFAAGVPLFRS